MNSNRNFKKVCRIARWLLLVGLLFIVVSCEPAGFHVTKVSLKAPAWVPPADYTYKVVVTISFNRPVDKNTFKAPGTVTINLKGLSSGGFALNIDGSFQFSKDLKTAVFISKDTLADLINPQPGENVQYTIMVVGTDVGLGAVTDSNGEALDGDKDGKPGGNFITTLEAIG